MCHIKNAYKTSDELLVDLNKCASCPSIGSLISAPNECPIFQGMLKRYTVMIQREHLQHFQDKGQNEGKFTVQKGREEDIGIEEVVCVVSP